jgi:hypothetical protein
MKLIPTISISRWIEKKCMSEEEKKANPSYEVTCGYLKEIPYKEAWKAAWDALDEEQKIKITKHSCFDAKKFDYITGLNTVSFLLEGEILDG